MITRAVLFRNDADGPLTLNKAASACLDLPFGSWDLIHFQGRHCMERQKERMPLPRAVTTLRSARGASSHHHNPFAILAAPDAGEEAGECLGAMLVYSGNFKIECEVSQMGSTRLVAGISDENFSWTLAPGESFTAPEVLFSYSATGLGDLSHQYHRFLQDHVIRSRWKDRPRPVLLNNWEATYMDFDASGCTGLPGRPGNWGWNCSFWTTAGSVTGWMTRVVWATGRSMRSSWAAPCRN